MVDDGGNSHSKRSHGQQKGFQMVRLYGVVSIDAAFKAEFKNEHSTPVGWPPPTRDVDQN